jgi:F-type H+-transporting ATPase subunit delta
MVTGSVSRRYARALLQIGVEEKSYEQIGNELRQLAAAIKLSPELASTLANPVFPRADRERVLRALLERIGAGPTVVNTIRLLLERERLNILVDLSRELDVLIDALAGRVNARVSSATPLDDTQRERLMRSLETLSGKKVDMVVHHDPSLLGGVVAQVGDIVYDGSLRTQLERMRHDLIS